MSWVSKGFIIRKSVINIYETEYIEEITATVVIEEEISNAICGENGLIIHKGDSKTIKVTITDKSGNPVDLTPFELRFSVKIKKSDTSYIFQKKNANAGGDFTQIEMTDPIDGVCKVFIKPEDTISLRDKISNFIFDIEMKQGNNVKTVIEDELILIDDVTR